MSTVSPFGDITPTEALANLTARQQAIVRLTGEGLKQREIAVRLGMKSVKTVSAHYARIKRKLGWPGPPKTLCEALGLKREEAPSPTWPKRAYRKCGVCGCRTETNPCHNCGQKATT